MSRDCTSDDKVLASLASGLIVVDLCISAALPTVVIGNLLHADSELTLDNEQASWLGSIVFFCQPIGSVLSSVIVETLGRKRSMLLLNVPYFAGFVLLFVANSYPILVLANVLLGIIIGLTEAPLSCYIGEVAQPEIRGVMIGVVGVMAYASWLLEYFLGAVTTWRIAIAVSAVTPVVSAILIAPIPESPIWLISKERVEDAKKALCWLRGWTRPEAVAQEFQDLMNYYSKLQQSSQLDEGHVNSAFVEEDQNTPSESHLSKTTENAKDEMQKMSCCEKMMAVLRDMVKAPTLRPTILTTILFFFVQWAGLMSIRAYLIHVFDEFQTPISSKWSTVLSAAMCMFGAVVVMLLVHRCGKRLISLACTAAMAVVTILLGLYAYIQVRQDRPAAYTWIPLVLILAMSFINAIFGQVPWMFVSEAFPLRTRGLAGGVSAALGYIFLFLASKTYLDMERTFKLHGTFWCYGCINIIAFVYLYVKLMETEGRTLEEIESHFTKGECPKTVKRSRCYTTNVTESSAASEIGKKRKYVL